MNNTSTIAENLRSVRDDLEHGLRAAARQPGDTTLVAVSKTKPAAAIRQALRAGQRVFGENRIQEAREKWPELKADYPDTRLHLIGPLQTNKVKFVTGLFDVIETLDREKLARALAQAFAKSGVTVDCFVQVNTGAEPQKAGILPGDVDGFIATCRATYDLPLRGLMCIPPQTEEPALHFALLREIARRNGLAGLSMGMTADYPTAIRFGATHVRIGTAIFGARPPLQSA